MLNINNEKSKSNIKMSKPKINLLSWMCVLFYSSFVCVSAYVSVYFQKIFNQNSCVRGPLQECHLIWSGASRLPYYCAPQICVSDVIESLAVWRHNKPKTKNQPSAQAATCVGQHQKTNVSFDFPIPHSLIIGNGRFAKNQRS